MISLDHLVLPVSDLDGAADELSRAGFVVTPTAEHPFGTANRLVVFPDSYLELVSVVHADRIPDFGFARTVADHLASGMTGFSHVVGAADSVSDAETSIRANGRTPGPAMTFARPAPRSDGSTMTASFTIVPVAENESIFFCVHHTPEAVWFQGHLVHPNGVRDMRSVRVAAPLELAVDMVEVGPDGIEVGLPAPVTIAGVRIV